MSNDNDVIEVLKKRISSLAYRPAISSPLPMILEVQAADGVHWSECSNCREELIGVGMDYGYLQECVQCGNRWFDGELVELLTDKDKCDRCGWIIGQCVCDTLPEQDNG